MVREELLRCHCRRRRRFGCPFTPKVAEQRVVSPTTFVEDLNQETLANKASDSKATLLMAMLLGLGSSLPPAHA